MSVHDKKIIEKIRKCLSLAKSSNAHEAAIALRQAQNMMQTHGFNDLDVEAASATEKYASSSVKTRPSLWETNLAVTAAEAFCCKSIFSRSMFNNARWVFIGVGSAPDLATYTFEVLLRQLKKDRRHYIKTKLSRCKPINKTIRADTYCQAWVIEVYGTIQHFAPNKMQDKAINAYMEKHYSAAKKLAAKSRKSKGITSDNQWKDQVEGAKDGANANLNRGVNENQASRLEQS